MRSRSLSMERYKLLIDILLNKTISLAERDDAAIDLAEFDEDIVISTLIKVAQDHLENYILLSSCGTSFAEIILKRNPTYAEIQAYKEKIKSFAQPARSEAEALINYG